MRPDVLADHLGQTIRGLVGPMSLRVAELEATSQRAAIGLEGVNASLGDLGARVAALEARALVPGPPGPPGPPGKDGLDGKDARWNYCGIHVTGKAYDPGDLVTDKGSLFLCARPTTQGRPGASSDWTLIVKRGQDGKDLR